MGSSRYTWIAVRDQLWVKEPLVDVAQLDLSSDDLRRHRPTSAEDVALASIAQADIDREPRAVLRRLLQLVDGNLHLRGELVLV